MLILSTGKPCSFVTYSLALATSAVRLRAVTTFSLNGRTVSVDSPSDAEVAVGYQSQPGTSGGVKAALGRLRQLPGGFFVSPKKKPVLLATGSSWEKGYYAKPGCTL
jgi:hypothetical protein